MRRAETDLKDHSSAGWGHFYSQEHEQPKNRALFFGFCVATAAKGRSMFRNCGGFGHALADMFAHSSSILAKHWFASVRIIGKVRQVSLGELIAYEHPRLDDNHGCCFLFLFDGGLFVHALLHSNVYSFVFMCVLF